MLYGTTQWDPILIVAQILVIQAIGYSIWGALGLIVFVGILKTPLHECNASILFDIEHLTDSPYNVVLAYCLQLIVALGNGFVVAWVVKRAKKCMDFSCT